MTSRSEFRDQPTRRRDMPVLFREEPVVPREHTAVGIAIGPPRAPAPRARRWDLFIQLVGGPHLRALRPCLRAFELGDYYEAYSLTKER